jgi:hypothetical protein
VVADALDHRVGAGVAHREPLAHRAADERGTAGGAEQDHVAADDVVLGHVSSGELSEGAARAAGQALADVVVGVAVPAA